MGSRCRDGGRFSWHAFVFTLVPASGYVYTEYLSGIGRCNAIMEYLGVKLYEAGFKTVFESRRSGDLDLFDNQRIYCLSVFWLMIS